MDGSGDGSGISEERITQLEREISELTAMLRDGLQTKQTEETHKEKNLSILARQIEELDAENSNLRSQNEELKKSLEKAQEQNKAISEKSRKEQDEYEKNLKEIKRKADNYNYIEEKLTKLTRQLNEVKSENVDIKKHNDKLKEILQANEGEKKKRKELETKLEEKNKRLEEYKRTFEEYEEKLKELKRKIDEHSFSEEKLTKLTKQLNEIKAEKEASEERYEKLKEMMEKSKKNYPERIKERDEAIKKLNSQVSVLKREKNVIDETNVRLFSEIDHLQADLKKLNNQIETKDKEVHQVRELLNNEKKLSEERLRKRLREFAQKETKKHIMLTVRIKELLDLVNRQREVIENVDRADMTLYDLINNTINQIRENRRSIDYSVVEKKIEDMSTDIASVADLIDMPEEEITEALEKSKEQEIENEFNVEDEETESERRIRESARRSIENGDSADMIRRSLIDSGEDESLVDKVLDKELENQKANT